MIQVSKTLQTWQDLGKINIFTWTALGTLSSFGPHLFLANINLSAF